MVRRTRSANASGLAHIPIASGASLVVALLAAFVSLSARAEFANPYGVAVIIGNRSYENERVPEVSYAHRDAEAFRRQNERR